ncbi:hypothetical protein ZWY2020_050768 [Hordeum vulgare]|nr:hypothetical protein ZWY2020_050768 [Hordeum vulgare]
MPDLRCDGDGVCMVCRAAPPPEVELLRCVTCATSWHSPCLSKPPALTDAVGWACPDFGDEGPPPTAALGGAGSGSGLLATIREIEADAILFEQDKAWRRQELLGGKSVAAGSGTTTTTRNKTKTARTTRLRSSARTSVRLLHEAPRAPRHHEHSSVPSSHPLLYSPPSVFIKLINAHD